MASKKRAKTANGNRETIIELRDVWKSFIIRHNSHRALKMMFLSLFHPRYRERKEKFCALKGIDLAVKKGEALGLIGPNGAGKSTLLYLLAGTLAPDSGNIEIRGRIAPIAGIGLGFHHELSGRENLFLSGSLYGMRKSEIQSLYQRIVDFAEIGDFMDVPVKAYSTGMVARLSFSISVHLEAEILLIDEVLSVGDAYFQEKCDTKMREFRERGKTIILVSHSPAAIKSLCDRVCWISAGKIISQGPTSRVLAEYTSASVENQGTTSACIS